MIRHSFGPALLASVLASPVWAFGEVGRWSSGWGQGTAEYVVVDARQNQLYIACNDTGPATMALTVGGRNYTREQGDFVLFIDGKGPYYASDAGSRAGGDNFRVAWDALRTGRSVQARTGDGKVVTFPLTGAAKVLPARTSKLFQCVTW